MFKLQTDPMQALEKITSFPYFLFLISLVLFIDVYLVYNYNVVIWQVDTEWLKAHATNSEISAFVIWFVLLYLFAMPVLHVVVVFILAYLYLHLPANLITSSKSFDLNKYVSLNTLRDFSIQHNNATAYKLYEEERDKRNTWENNRNSI